VALSFEEAKAVVGGPGQIFELQDAVVNGVSYRTIKNAPHNLGSLFASSRGLHETFVVYEDEEWTFDAVMVQADALAHALVHDFGIKPGDRVGIAMRNLPEWVMSFAAITSIGAISVSFNAWWTEEENDYAINDAGVNLLIADIERINRTLVPCQRAGVPIIGVRINDGEVRPGVTRWQDVVVPGTPMPQVTVTPDMDATILFTSGTTGFPKGAVSTHFAVVQSIMAFSAKSQVTSLRRTSPEEAGGLPPCFILVVPLFHVTGCVPVMLSCFSWHFKLVIMYKWDAEKALQMIEKYKVTSFVGVPTQSWDLLECPSFSKYDTSSLSSIGGGGAPAPPKLVDRVEKSFKKGRPGLGYGMTETNAFGPGTYGDDFVNNPTSTGRVPEFVMDVEIRDDEGHAVANNVSGEIWMKSPTNIRGYWNKPDATASTIVDGWLRTGDLGHIDDEGFLYIEDRLKDMILRGGENVYSAEVEAAIYENPAVYEAAVFGLAHERLGEEVATVVMLREGVTLSEDELRDFLKTRLASFKIPTRYAFTNEPLPRNPAGKFLKREMPKIYFA